MKFENKICFLIGWSRELDMFKYLIQKLKKKEIIFIINDLNKVKKNHKLEQLNIRRILNKKNYKTKFLSRVLNKNKYKILISTGDLPVSSVNLKSILKFLYSKTFGAVIEILKLNFFLKEMFGREFTAGGLSSSIYDNKFIEKKISHKSFKFPNGLDRNLKNFPDKRWINIFDFYFAASKIEKNLILDKFTKKKVFFIGYTRFDKEKNSKTELLRYFRINKNKKTILCCPNERILNLQNEKSFKRYLLFFEKLNDNYNVILRPHPKLKFTNLKLFKMITNSNLIIDLEPDRNIKNLFSISDLIVTDYGNSVLEAIYLNKKTIIFKWPNDHNFQIMFEKKNCLDFMVQKKLKKIDLFKEKNSQKFNKNLIDRIIRSTSYKRSIKAINTKYFKQNKNVINPIKIIKNEYNS